MCDLIKAQSDVTIKVVSIKGVCKYHKEVGQEYNLEKIAPAGMCLDAFHIVYPYCLSLTYGAQFTWMEDKDSVIAQCPHTKNTVTFEIRRVRLTEKKLQIRIKAIDARGSCHKGHKTGQEFIMNLGDFPEMCPAAFDELFPYVQILRFGGKVPWQKENDAVDMQCSDHINSIKFELIRKGR